MSATVQERIAQRRGPTLAAITRDAIEQMIVKGELEAGERINESGLSARLGVSRGPIREACRALEQEGLVRNAPNLGAFVRELDLNEARDLYEVRGGLAYAAGGLAAERRTAAELGALARMVDEMDGQAASDDVANYFTNNIAFHEALFAATKNAALMDSYKRIIKQLHLYRRRGLVQSGNLVASNAEHRVILNAVRDGVIGDAADAMRAHVLSGWARLSAVR
ncbi:MAG: GntR family transcriptional regulator [Pseudomonadota bacterium]